MTFQNRVLPSGQIVAENWRGTMMGNRGGRIHDPKSKSLLKRRSASRRWICCVLKFKNRQRTVMGEGYTELFFMDEVSALAAGHRPCFECRRKDAVEFQRVWQKAFDLKTKPGADLMDKQLHPERTGKNRIIIADELSTLPDGTMVSAGSSWYAMKNKIPMKWNSIGYSLETTPEGEIEILTPHSIIAVLSHGYLPVFHGSAHRLGVC